MFSEESVKLQKEGSRMILRYVEDYIEDRLRLLEVEEKPEIEVRVEEEREESVKIRAISILPDGRKVEHVIEASRLSLLRFPLLTHIKVKHPSEPFQPLLLTLPGKVSVGVSIQSLYRVTYFIQPPMKAYSLEARVLPLSLPSTLSGIYSWLKDDMKPVNIFKQSGIVAYTSERLLRLAEIPVKLPVFNAIEVKVRLPTLTYEKLPLHQGITVKLTETVERLHTKIQAQLLNGKGLLELLIPEEGGLRRLSGAFREYVGEPVIIILPEGKDRLWYLFWVVCRELYREVRGAYPRPFILLEKGLDEWLRLYGRISGSIVVLHEKDVRVGGNREGEEWFRKRLKEAFSQGLGFLIVLAEDVIEAEGFIKELSKPYMPRIITLRPESPQLLTRLAHILSSVFGVPYEEIVKIEGDVMVARVDRAYRDLVHELLASDYAAFVRRDVSKRETEDHVALKVLAVKDLVEKFNVKLENISSTCEMGNDVIADICVEERALAVECETLIGAGPAPILKIVESVKKYVEQATKPVGEIWVVIRNWPAALHLGDLYKAQEALRKELEQRGKKLKFLVPNIHGKSLQALDDVVTTITLEYQGRHPHLKP
ncbi:MAG: hypothetical protein P3X22_000930 [Thermoprotei archaeon]|nr:hypothetical protein [Thermoprotei archaeon]